MTQFQKPILLVTFNRAGTTARVFEAIRKVRPARLYVFSDGARSQVTGEQERVQEVRDLFSQVDNTIQIFRNYQQENLGCARGVTAAISWIFENEDEAIILEDDCLPHPSFFKFCEVMLDRYRDNAKVFHIAGTRWNPEFAVDSSYFFSSIGHVWGWATWRRAWREFTFLTKDGPPIKNELREILGTQLNAQYWLDLFRTVSGGTRNIWDYHWQHTLFRKKALAVVPSVNLITNIGVEGTHFGHPRNDLFSRYVHHVPTEEWTDDGGTVAVHQHRRFDKHHMKYHFMRRLPLIKRVKKLFRYYAGT